MKTFLKSGKRNRKPRKYRIGREMLCSYLILLVIFPMSLVFLLHSFPIFALTSPGQNNMALSDSPAFTPVSPLHNESGIKTGKIWVQNGLDEYSMGSIDKLIRENNSTAIFLLSDEEIKLEHLDEPVEFDPMHYIKILWSQTDLIPVLDIRTDINKDKDGKYTAIYTLRMKDEEIEKKELKIIVETPEWKIREREELRKREERKREKEERTKKFLDYAVSQIGSGPSGPLSYFGHDEAWCSEFVSYCAHMTGLLEGTNIFPKYSYCAEGISFFKNIGRFHTKASGYIPQPGDVVFFGRNGESHTGIVRSYSDGVIHTIEGNSTGGDYHHTRVAEHTRKLSDSYVYGFGNPDF